MWAGGVVNPRGPLPHAIAAVDDQLFDAQCVAECTEDVVEQTITDFCRAWMDGEVTAPEAKQLGQDFKRLQGLTREQCVLLGSVRDGMNKVSELVRSLRARLQQGKGVAR